MTSPTLEQRLAKSLSASGASSLSSPSFASFQDSLDPLAKFRAYFNFPSKATVAGEAVSPSASVNVAPGRGEESVYLAGNSLGLMPKLTPALIQQELSVWSHAGVLGHMDHPHDRPWVRIDECVTPILARIVGAQQDEVACMGSLTANLHLLLTSFYKPTVARHKILYEGKAFPSDSVRTLPSASFARRRGRGLTLR